MVMSKSISDEGVPDGVRGRILALLDEHEFRVTGTPKHWGKTDERIAMDNELLNSLLALFEELCREVIGDELEEGDGWEWAFGKEAKCCPGDDFAYYGNHIKKLQRQRLSSLLSSDGRGA